VIVIGLGRLAVGAQRRRPHAAKYGLVGMEAESLAPLGPHVQGQVRVRGEIWRAVADVPVPAGRTVRVAGVDGLTLHVRPSDEFDRSGGPR
jgi:membrane-bound serine protease (ClpP class)